MVRFTLAAISAGVAWWAIGLAIAPAVFGCLLPLATERQHVLWRCLEMMQALCVGATFTIFGLIVFPAAFLTHWLLRRMAQGDVAVAVEIPIEE